MEVVVPPPTLDFEFDGAYSSTCFKEKPGTPKAKSKDTDQGAHENAGDDFEFEFEFSGQLGRASLSAEELFDKGKIRPLKPPPGYEHSTSQSSPPRSPSSRESLSKKKELDPFRAAFEETRRKEEDCPITRQEIRGREAIRTSSARKKGSSRSLSPLRVTDIVFGDQQEEENTTSKSNCYNGSIFSALSFSSNRYRKWKLKDLLLFRSASEGSGSTRISREGSMGGKYVVLSKKETGEEVKSSSFRSTEGSFSRRRLSSAELHYVANRAVAEEMRRKTALPYKQGFLGCLGFSYHNPTVHELSRGIGSFSCDR